jgi:hypothetical protein
MNYLLSPRRTPLALAFCFALASIANGQAVEVFKPIGLPSFASSSQTESGHLFGVLARDAVLLIEDEVYVLSDPSIYNSITSVPAVANGMCVERRAPFALDRLWTVGIDGLKRFTWDGDDFVDDAPVNQHPNWIDADGLAIGWIGGGAKGIVAWKGKKLGVCRTFSNPWTATSWLNLGEPIKHVETLQWDGNGAQEFCILTASRVLVMNFVGQTLFQSVLTNGMEMSTFTMPGAQSDGFVAFSTNAAGTTQILQVYATGGLHDELDLVATDVKGVDAGTEDTDGNGVLDAVRIVVASGIGEPLTSYRAKLTASGLDVEPNHAYRIGAGQGGVTSVASPHLSDFDQDGDLDLVFHPEGKSDTLFYLGSAMDEGLFQCTAVLGEMTVEPETGYGIFEMVLSVPDDTAQFTHAAVSVWHQPSPYIFMESTPWMPTVFHDLDGPKTFEVNINTQHTQFFQSVYYIETHLVVRDEAGMVHRKSPGWVTAVGLDGPAELTFLLDGYPPVTDVWMEVPIQFTEGFEDPPAALVGPLKPNVSAPHAGLPISDYYHGVIILPGTAIGGGSGGGRPGSGDSPPDNPPNSGL